MRGPPLRQYSPISQKSCSPVTALYVPLLQHLLLLLLVVREMESLPHPTPILQKKKARKRERECGGTEFPFL